MTDSKHHAGPMLDLLMPKGQRDNLCPGWGMLSLQWMWVVIQALGIWPVLAFGISFW